MMQRGRLPDFIIIGAMKSGTTSLYAWLARQPEVFLPSIKEPNFFSHEKVWKRGLHWYTSLFAHAAGDRLTGEASVSYTSPDRCELAADRMWGQVPGARLVYLVRHPIERMRSHYRHQVQRGRERRPFDEAIRDTRAPYVAQSRFFSCVKPYIDRFPRDQICVARMEDLSADPPIAWLQVLRHLGLEPRPAPNAAYNVTGDKAGFSRAMLWLWDSGLHRPLGRLPQPLRAIGKRVLLRRDPEYDHLLEGSGDPVPAEVADPVWEDVRRLESWLEVEAPLWTSEVAG